ncbi:amino acid ABC transporter permease [Cupriavidus consociatus]|uniref:amino acid ABC transporter permease n=1 Tax=Cupriavidus consociatus TaxID=2821357 RepID=UPI001AE8FF22|nr:MULTISPECIES: amino acid ABC transporter permease [unclassified Cupriavidus]MBP0623375.1 amino acid ABC transporter permease [Cupriavidus sp. LEh25]MDK2660073.1 amino acid ABC transporter permease [Cupriavidus sp. LEh21]
MSITVSDEFCPIDPRPAPIKTEGLMAWVRLNLFSSVWNGLATLIALAFLVRAGAALLDWGLLRAVFAADAEQCHALRGTGACWGVVTEKFRFIVFGRYPFDEQWRPLIATVLLVGMLVLSGIRAFWKRWLVALWVVVIPLFFILMRGNVLGLSHVTTDLWGGLPLTILLASFGIILACPLAVVVALGRRSKLPAIRSVCVIYVELIRGVPLISVLFMASFMFPLFLPPGTSPDVLVRVLAGITLFSAAYLAEVVRAGLQAVPKGQVEAAQTLGLTYWQTQRKIVLPQALAMVVPSIVNIFIGIFKDTSLVTIVSLYELTGSLSLALNSDVNWRPYKIEGYLFIAFLYFIFCFSMSRYSLRVEKHATRSKVR